MTLSKAEGVFFLVRFAQNTPRSFSLKNLTRKGALKGALLSTDARFILLYTRAYEPCLRA